MHIRSVAAFAEMDGFDGELYLRLLGERTLLSAGSAYRVGDPLVERARALTTVGVVPLAVAQRVVDDYARARALRGIAEPRGFGPVPTAPQPPRRIAPCRRVLRQPTGELEIRHAILTQAETRLAITFRSGVRLPPNVAQQHAIMPAGVSTVPTISVTDDRGHTVSSSMFSGGGTQSQWRGFLTLHPGLAPDTKWIEIYGERVALGPDLGHGAVTIENLADEHTVDRYLDQCLAAPGTRSLPEALAALTAAGLVNPADPMIAAYVAAHEALRRGGGPVDLPPELPAGRWRSLLARRGTTGGPTGTLFVGAATPPFDRVSATLLDLTSTDAGFRCELELTGPMEIGRAAGATLDATLVTFGALDDAGGSYLGQLDTWSGGGDSISGTIGFWPALDPKASRLDLILTTDRARAVVAVPLSWDETP